MDDNNIRKNLLKLRKRHGYNQQTLADAIGKVRNTYIAIEQGPTEIINKNIYKIADFYGITPEEIILGYKPEELDSRALMSTREYEEQIATLKQEHGREVEAYEKRIRDLEEKLDHRDKLEAYLLTLLPKND